MGRFRGVIKTHGQLFYSEAEKVAVGGGWKSPCWEKNPYTNEPWTKEEINNLQAGISAIAGVSPGGLVICDQLKIEIQPP